MKKKVFLRLRLTGKWRIMKNYKQAFENKEFFD